MGEIVCQDEAIKLLRKAKEAGKVSTSFLFIGPEGVGKLTTAKWFAALINCENNKKVPCGSCSLCEKIEKNNHPDVVIIAPEGEYLKINQFRKMQKDIIYKPYSARYKVFIIQAAHKMQEASANSLLKAIEEPPENTVIILTATSTSKLLPTITSRCQKVRFNLLPKNKIAEILKNHEVPQNKAEIIASCCSGNLKKAYRLSQDDSFWNTREKIHEIAKSIYKLNLYEALQAANIIEKKFKTKIDEVLFFFLSWFKDLMLTKERCSSNLIENIDKKEVLLDTSKKYSLLQIKNSLDIIIEARKSYKTNANLSILLANMLVDLQQKT